MNVDVDVQNPNAVALPLSNVDYGLGLGGVKVIDKARAKPASSIPANGTGTVTIPVALTFENLLAAEEAIRKGGGAVEYALNAGLNFDTGLPVIGVQRVPIRHEGTLDVRELLSRNWGTILTSPAARELAQQVLGGTFRF
jgi:LEA14-like dessication related protein